MSDSTCGNCRFACALPWPSPWKGWTSEPQVRCEVPDPGPFGSSMAKWAFRNWRDDIDRAQRWSEETFDARHKLNCTLFPRHETVAPHHFCAQHKESPK